MPIEGKYSLFHNYSLDYSPAKSWNYIAGSGGIDVVVVVHAVVVVYSIAAVRARSRLRRRWQGDNWTLAGFVSPCVVFGSGG